MKKEKGFDCVEMKNRIQQELEREYAGLTEEERRERIRHELETSDDPVARKWRSLATRETTIR